MKTIGETRTITITREAADLIETAVAMGGFSDAIRQALEPRMPIEGDLLGLTPEEITRIWDAGIASGISAGLDLADIKREIRQSEHVRAGS